MTRVLLLLGAAGLAAACAPSAPTPVPAPLAPMKASTVDAPADAYFGQDDVCAACHGEQSASYAATVHAAALANASRPPELRGCEACHGPAKAHVEAGGAGGDLQAFAATEPAEVRSAVCMRCHAADHTLYDFESAEHARAGVACTDCHDPHGGAGAAMLRIRDPALDPLTQPLRGPTWREQEIVVQLCYRCHADVRSDFAMPERHKVPEGVVSCLDCHQPHGTRNAAMLRASDDHTCTRCHGEVEGPWVFEHFGLTLEGCASCHEPHGSANRHLLKYQQVAQLCYQCHAVTPASHVQPAYRDCTRCHVAIHGSNADPRFLEP